MASDLGGPELKMDPTSLYREDTYTDRKIGTIRVLTPVTADGATDLGRKILYVPIGALSPTKLKRLRVVHVLDSYERRKEAKDYLW